MSVVTLLNCSTPTLAYVSKNTSLNCSTLPLTSVELVLSSVVAPASLDVPKNTYMPAQYFVLPGGLVFTDKTKSKLTYNDTIKRRVEKIN